MHTNTDVLLVSRGISEVESSGRVSGGGPSKCAAALTGVTTIQEGSQSAGSRTQTGSAWLSFAFVLALISVFCPSAFAQRYQSFSGSGRGTWTYEVVGKACPYQGSGSTVGVDSDFGDGFSIYLDGFGGGFGGFHMHSLVRKVGTGWEPFTDIRTIYIEAKCEGIFGGQVTLTTTLSKSGVLTQSASHVQGFYYLLNLGLTFSFVETLDLNSGAWSYHRREQYNDVIGNTGVVSESEDAEGTVDLKFVLASNALSITAVNPSACATTFQCWPTLVVDPALAPNAPSALMLAADGVSAAVLAITAPSANPVTLSLTNATGTAGDPGSLGVFNSAYLTNPQPTIDVSSLKVTPTCDSSGYCTALALLWSPQMVPSSTSSSAFTPATVNITATQDTSTAQTSIDLDPPPLLLVHVVWSNAAAAWTPFLAWLNNGNYPHNIIGTVDYGPWNFTAFNSPNIQNQMSSSVNSLLQQAAAQGMSARTIDVVGHSMGGLVTRYFEGNIPSPYTAILPANPVHKFITIGTPHLGSPLAALLDTYKSNTTRNPLINTFICSNPFQPISPCTLGNVLSAQGDIIDTATMSLEPTSDALKKLASPPYSAIVGEEPTSSPFPLPLSANSGTELKLSLLTASFLPGAPTDYSILGTGNDTIVSNASQNAGAADTATITGVVHTALVSYDIGETASPAVWNQLVYWLSGGVGQAPSASSSAVAKLRALDVTSSPSPLILDLTGYTQIDASNVTFTPTSASTLTLNSPIGIAATSAKTITEVLLFQSVADPSDTSFLYSTQSPFSIPFTPTRMGTTNFTAIALFNDNTYAVTYLSYTLQPSGTPTSLTLVNLPQGSMAVGSQLVTHAQASFSSGLNDVTQSATYTTGSGTTNVFSVVGGLITANGPGVDTLNVSYGG